MLRQISSVVGELQVSIGARQYDSPARIPGILAGITPPLPASIHLWTTFSDMNSTKCRGDDSICLEPSHLSPRNLLKNHEIT